MSFSLLLSKSILVPTGGAVAVGASAGGAYYVYSTKYSGNASNNSLTNLKTNSFLARVQKTGANSITANTPLKCVIATGKEVDCKVFKFKTTKTSNAISKFTKSTDLTEIATPASDLVQLNYVLVELQGKTITFEELKNKTIDLKSGNSELTKLDFDQVLVKSTEGTGTEIKEVYEPVKATTETYIVSTGTAAPTSVSVDPATKTFKCTYILASKLINIDDSCKLISITAPTTPKKITSLTELKSETTAATDLAASTYYKLTVNSNLLYNLTFPNPENSLTVEVVVNTTSKSAPLTLHQKLSGEEFVGKTNLILGKVTATKSDIDGNSTDSHCNFNKTTPQTGNFACTVQAATEVSESPLDLHKLDISTSAIQDDEAFALNKYFLIKLTDAQETSILTKGKKIYYQKNKTGDTNKHESVELEVVQLLSGESETGKKHFFISNYSN